jgi:hypothetical protein
MKTPKFLLRLFKKPPTPRVAHSSAPATPPYRSFSTPAQIRAYAHARFDRIKFANGDADEQDVPEPGVKVRELGFLDLSEVPASVGPLDLQVSCPFSLHTLPERRSGSRARAGE